jgi:hypothetical protein
LVEDYNTSTDGIRRQKNQEIGDLNKINAFYPIDLYKLYINTYRWHIPLQHT